MSDADRPSGPRDAGPAAGPPTLSGAVDAPSVESALPPVGARVAAFVGILVAGGIGGAIGYWFSVLQCSGSCTVPNGLMMLVGTFVLALGAAVVAVLSLRALADWNGDRLTEQVAERSAAR